MTDRKYFGSSACNENSLSIDGDLIEFGSIKESSDLPSMVRKTKSHQRLSKKMSLLRVTNQVLLIEGQVTEDIENEKAKEGECSFTKMAPPSTLTNRKAFGDLNNVVGSSMNITKFFPRHRSAFDVTTSSTFASRKRTVPRCDFSRQEENHSKFRVMEDDRKASTSSEQEKNEVKVVCPTFFRAHSSSFLIGGRHSPRSKELPFHLEVTYSLTVLDKIDSQAYRRIANDSLVSIMKSTDFESKFCLIDCRYKYEYENGHIKSAINVYDPQSIGQLLFDASSLINSADGKQKRIPIFYCEFSQKRGPNMAQAVRTFDRIKNQLNYPHVDHPEMYVLEGGYSAFFEKHGSEEFCCPNQYIKMDDERFNSELRKFDFHKKHYSACATVARGPPPCKSRLSVNSPLNFGRQSSRRNLLFSPPTPKSSSSKASISSANNENIESL